MAQLRLLDILADPDDPSKWPLKLKVFKSEIKDRKQIPRPHENSGLLCKFYCYRKNKYLVSDPLGDDEKLLEKSELDKIVTLKECHECIREEIIGGLLYHGEGSDLKWFIIDREIAVMYPLDIRDSEQERIFIERYPNEMKENGIKEPYS